MIRRNLSFRDMVRFLTILIAGTTAFMWLIGINPTRITSDVAVSIILMCLMVLFVTDNPL